MSATAPVLFVAWQSPSTRLIHPVGRLIRRDDLNLYEYCYIRRALSAANQGFVPFIEFPKFDSVYFSERLFPWFANRVLPASRPEYASHIQSLGLDTSTADPMSILARTGGRRQTDHTELFPLPLPDPATGMYVTHCLLRGIRHLPDPATENRIAQLQPGDSLRAIHEPDNPADPHAMSVWTDDSVKTGYLPAYLAHDAGHLCERCEIFEVHVERVNPPPTGVHERVLLRVDACWPDDFEPFATADFWPLAKNATDIRNWTAPEAAAS